MVGTVITVQNPDLQPKCTGLTVYDRMFGDSQPRILYINRICMVLANPNHSIANNFSCPLKSPLQVSLPECLRLLSDNGNTVL